MRWVFRSMMAFGLAATMLAAGCGKKTMDTPAPEPTRPEPTRDIPPPPPPAPTQVPDRSNEGSRELGDVFFDYDSIDLRGDARTTLDSNGKILMQESDMRVSIEGHCDERGTVDYNLALGERRAQVAKDFLVSFGVAADRMQTISYGENRPFATGSDETAFSQNRRAHFASGR